MDHDVSIVMPFSSRMMTLERLLYSYCWRYFQQKHRVETAQVSLTQWVDDLKSHLYAVACVLSMAPRFYNEQYQGSIFVLASVDGPTHSLEPHILRTVENE